MVSTFLLAFSDDVDIEPDKMRDQALLVSDGTVTAASRVTPITAAAPLWGAFNGSRHRQARLSGPGSQFRRRLNGRSAGRRETPQGDLAGSRYLCLGAVLTP